MSDSAPRVRWPRRGGRRRARGRVVLLELGGPVDVPCWLRRTSSRGWGAWMAGTLHLRGFGVSHATFTAADPGAVALVSAIGAAPVPLADATKVALRPVRFKGEAFFGLPAEIVVFSTDRHITEIAVAPQETEAVRSRLSALSAARPVSGAS